MPSNAGSITKSLNQILTVIEHMASPNGTTINEMSKCLSLTHRSVFRLIRTIEHDLNIPVIVDRKTFGGTATYRLPADFVNKFSHITTPPLILSFQQAILFYLIFNNDTFYDKSTRQDKS